MAPNQTKPLESFVDKDLNIRWKQLVYMLIDDSVLKGDVVAISLVSSILLLSFLKSSNLTFVPEK